MILGDDLNFGSWFPEDCDKISESGQIRTAVLV